MDEATTVEPIAETDVKPPDDAPAADKPAEKPPAFTPEELAEYDAETIRRVNEQLASVDEAETLHATYAERAKSAKKNLEVAQDRLCALIRYRRDNRGKKPSQTLLDFVKPEPKWHSLGLDALGLTDELKAKLSGIDDLEDLYEQVNSPETANDVPLGLSLDELTTIRAGLQAIIDMEAQEAEAAEKARIAATPSELWREFPIARWTIFGITDKDAEKLEAGEVKRETGRRPIITVGDLSKFSEPTAGGYSRGYADIKGIGEAGATRISDAETAFWSWWKNGGEAEFATERGVSRGDASAAGTDGSVPAAGDQAAPEVDAAATFPSYTDPEEQAERTPETGKVQKRKGKRRPVAV